MGADFFNAIQTMKDRLGAPAVAVQVPMGAEDNFWGVIDLVTMTAWDFKADDKGMTYPEPMDAIPAEFAEEAELRRQEPVSYTHLDVYKRQPPVRPTQASAPFSAAARSTPSSHGQPSRKNFS